MNRKSVLPLFSALAVPCFSLGMFAQQITGVSRPTDSTETSTQADHYVKPVHTEATTAGYQDSFPATASEPHLLSRDANSSPAVVPPAPVVKSDVKNAVPTSTDDTDAQIVLEVPASPHELHRGTLLHARLREGLNTRTTAEGSVFTAEVLSDAESRGEVVLPAGSLLRGHVTSVHGGKRITGGASIHLQPETVSLPDGTLYRLNAQLTDLESTQDLRVNDEGTVVLRSNPKAAAAVVGGVTGTAAVTGAVLGGGVGAAVGAVAGAGIATAVYLKREVQEVLPSGTNVIFSLETPLAVTPR